jgi:hypothetical protein
VRDPTRDQFLLRGKIDPALQAKQPFTIRHIWLTEIRPDGSLAFRRLKQVTLTARENDILAATPAVFPTAEFSKQNLALFRANMRRALVEEGLFGDEADALLNTWELSYFKSAGLRLFFVVPRAWTDHYLPLEVTVAAQMQRVMVGRIELVTPAQRTLLKKIAMGPSPDPFTVADIKVPDADYRRLVRGKTSLASLGVSVPPAYQAYLDLGRFRNALILDEERRRPTEALREFIQKNGLKAYEIANP